MNHFRDGVQVLLAIVLGIAISKGMIVMPSWQSYVIGFLVGFFFWKV
jgi:hypothetical protein